MSAAVVLGAWILALAVVAAPVAGLPVHALPGGFGDPRDPGGPGRLGLVACLALVAASVPRARRVAGRAARASLAGLAGPVVATLALFLPLAAVAGELDAQAGRPRAVPLAALAFTFASALAWAAERARGEASSAVRYGAGWALLLGLPAVAASVLGATSSLSWCPLVWCLGGSDASRAFGPAAAVALLVGVSLGARRDVARGL